MTDLSTIKAALEAGRISTLSWDQIAGLVAEVERLRDEYTKVQERRRKAREAHKVRKADLQRKDQIIGRLTEERDNWKRLYEEESAEYAEVAGAGDTRAVQTVIGRLKRELAETTARLREMERQDTRFAGPFTETAYHLAMVRAEQAERELAEAREAYAICRDHLPDRWEGDGTCVICEGQRLEAKVREQAERIKELVQRIEVLETAVGNIAQTTMHYEFYGPTTALSEIASQARAALAADRPATEEK